MTVKRRRDDRTPRVLMHRVADVRGGVSVNVTELGGDYLREGTVLSAPVNGICHVVKVAQVAAAVEDAATTVKVSKFHNLKVGDAVLTATGGVAVTIKAIEEGKTYDTLTLSATLGAIAKDGFLVEAKVAADGTKTKGELKYEPFAVNGTGKPVIQGTNLDTDAWLIAVTKGNPLPGFVADKLKGIINY